MVAGFKPTDPAVGGIAVPVVRNWASKDLNPELFGLIGLELGESAGNAGERIDLKTLKSFDW